MKKSIIWRFIILAVVMFCWIFECFPPKDRDYFDVMQELAVDKDATFEKLVADAKDALDDPKNARRPSRIVRDLAKAQNIELKKYYAVYKDSKHEVPNKEVASYIGRMAAGKFRYGLDINGGTEFTIGFKLDDVPTDDDSTRVRDEIITIIRNRVDYSGTIEAEIKPTSENTISVSVPPTTPEAVAEIRSVLERVAKLRFHLVHKESDTLARQAMNDGSVLPVGYQLAEMHSDDENVEYGEKIVMAIEPSKMDGKNIKRAVANQQEFGSYSVNMEFNSDGAADFLALTSANIGERLAIVLDGVPFSAPTIQGAISANAEITGNFTAQESMNLAAVLQSGNLPVDIEIMGQTNVDPSLGREAVDSGIRAAIAGLILVVLFMVIYYRIPGVIAVIALVVNVALIMGTLALFAATITLPGIAGIVLTIGMAVDANVLIFERIREELLNKKSLGTAVKNGYERAFSTIFDANLTTLITALILFKVGTGAIRGFGVTLSIGIAASMFTALFMTRLIFDALLYSETLKKVTMMQMLTRTEYDFLGKRAQAMVVSGLAIVLCLGVFASRNKGAFSVDFSGGTQLTYGFTEEKDKEAIREVLETAKVSDKSIRVNYKGTGSGRQLEIVLSEQLKDDAGEKGGIGKTAMEKEQQILAVLNEKFSDAEFQSRDTLIIGSVVGGAFQKQAAMAIVLALLAIAAYITFRFELSYALGAVAALVHDVIIAMGVFLAWGVFARQISLPVIAALLTIIGYSLNDTIVVFDRIRENLELSRKKLKYEEIVNLSINQTLSRTLLTSLTTLTVVVTLYVFGGGAINDFALIMVVGVIIGTYSSVFVATPVMVFFHNRQTSTVTQESTQKVEAAKTTPQPE